MMSGKSASIAHPIATRLDPSKYHFVLVHGFGGGAWGWYKVRTLLEASGFKVTCLDLKASGINLSPVDYVHSFDDYTQPLTHFFEQYSPTHCDEKVILVGHSAGGLNVTDATYKFANKIDVAVYVAATMLKHGFATEQDIIDGKPKKIRAEVDDHDSRSNQKMEIQVPSEDVVLGRMLRRPGPLKAILEARFQGSGQVDCVPRIYISTLQDETLKPKQQEAMIRRWPPARVFALDTDHNHTVSAPFLLAGLLAKATYECFI